VAKPVLKLFKPLAMSIQIVPIEKNKEYLVNGKIVYHDQNYSWIAKEELTEQEKQAFKNYKKLFIDSKAKTHTKSTFKI